MQPEFHNFEKFWSHILSVRFASVIFCAIVWGTVMSCKKKVCEKNFGHRLNHWVAEFSTVITMVGWPRCTYPSIHVETLKITVGCRLCWVACGVLVCVVSVWWRVCMYMWRCVYMLWCGVVVWCGAAWIAESSSVCRFKTPPCVRSRRLRVYPENARMCWNQVCNFQCYFPHDSIACSFWFDWYNWLTTVTFLSQTLFHFVTELTTVFTDHSNSGRPTLAKYKHLRTIWAQTTESSPVVSQSSGGIRWSSLHGVATCWREDTFFFAISQYLPTHMSPWPFHVKAPKQWSFPTTLFFRLIFFVSLSWRR